jgi:hypothetical protein
MVGIKVVILINLNQMNYNNDKLLSLYSSSNTRMVKSRIRQVTHEACMGRYEMHTQFELENLGMRPVGNLDIGQKKIS